MFLLAPLRRQTVRAEIKKIYKKRFDPEHQQFYYVNTRTGEVSWDKPINLGSEELPNPRDVWESMTDQYGNEFFLHALTGRTSWLSEERAAMMVQRQWRRRQASAYRIDDMSVIIKALRFQKDAERKYNMNPDRLSSIVNYALLLHCIDHDMAKAREVRARACVCVCVATHVLQVVTFLYNFIRPGAFAA